MCGQLLLMRRTGGLCKRREEVVRRMMILKGNLIDTREDRSFRIIEGGYLAVEGESIIGSFAKLPEQYQNEEIQDYGNRLIIPGLTDLHLHAPQFAFRGNGMDLELLDWLNRHTFPEERKYADLDYAGQCYGLFVQKLKESMTSRACIFATVHVPATLLLMDMLEESGLISYVGKVNMDRNCPDYLAEESAAASLAATKEWIEKSGKYRRTRPILTPRFIPSCTDELLHSLSDWNKGLGLAFQSHLSENPNECKWVSELCPDAGFYLEAYDKRGCFPPITENKAIMAHCVYSGEEEMRLLLERKIYVAHCPQSNTGLSSGIAPVRAFLDRGIRVGLGSDIAGGHSLSMLRIAADAMDVSKLRWRLVDSSLKALRASEAFYLASRGGGSYFGKVGAFEEGYAADIVVLDDSAIQSAFETGIEERIERVMYLSEECEITAKYVAGQRIL